MYNPRDWYWVADDGRVYGSASQSLIEAEDEVFRAWAETHRPTPWPVDDDGNQTEQALADVLKWHGLRMWVRDLVDAKAELKRVVDEMAEIERLKYITAGAGQAMTYAQKAEEARLCLDAAGPDPEDYPLLAAEIGITAITLVGVAQVVATANAQWLQIGAAIEAARLSAKKAISEAETVEDAHVAADAVVWP